LGHPQPVAVEAVKDWEFAWLSESAYGKTAEAKKARAKVAKSATGCPDSADILSAAGWNRWDNFPDDGLKARIVKSHLRVEVWSKNDPPSVAVAFGGTVFSSERDWLSNLRWFIPFRKDEYTEIVGVFGPAFIQKYSELANMTEWDYLAHATLYSTGHSLGGGLAQQFAYSLPTDNQVPRVTQVYAFDPSPVTGFYSVKPKTRNFNRKTLAIDRIYERGEILAMLRSLTSFISPPSATMPKIRAVRYNLFYSINPLSGHSIKELACKLEAASGGGIGDKS
jgi:hypothetical protein